MKLPTLMIKALTAVLPTNMKPIFLFYSCVNNTSLKKLCDKYHYNCEFSATKIAYVTLDLSSVTVTRWLKKNTGCITLDGEGGPI